MRGPLALGCLVALLALAACSGEPLTSSAPSAASAGAVPPAG